MSDSNRFQRLESLFQHARTLPRNERMAYIESECGDDADLISDVLALLAEDDHTRGAIDEPVLGESLEMERIGVPSLANRPTMPGQIGKYRIVRRVGEGGMGVVYEAEQDSPRRRVALKIINTGVASEKVLRRFDYEAEVLGRLQHPGIAQIFEAGMYDSGSGGQPYFAMEFVNGETISAYARRKNLSTRQRLVLLSRICDAVQHAHQRGIIHRDLKPANILVVDEPESTIGQSDTGTRMETEPVGQPKILDFGVARATDSDLKTTTMRTDIGQLIGTVPYMSPEQAAGDPDDLDTRSDVYALGVVAYELLAGQLPYDISEKMIHEAVRVIREDDPAPLSAIDRVLGGDIETIIGKALEKDKTRRYESAAALSSDIRRYLSDEPIAARPPSTWYQLRKFARRNRELVGGLAALFVVLVAATVVSTVFAVGESRAATAASDARDDAKAAAVVADAQRNEALLQASITEAVNIFLNEDLLSSVDPERGVRDITMREALDIASASIADQFENEPLIRAEIRQTLGRTYLGLGEFESARGHLERAVEICSEERGDDHPDTLEAMHLLADTYHNLGRADDAMQIYEDVLEYRIASLGENHVDTVSTLNNIALLKKESGAYDVARVLFEKILPIQIALTGPLDIDVLAIQTNLADVYSNLERFEQAEELFNEALVGRRKIYEPLHPRVLTTMGGLAQLYERQGRLDEAVAMFEEVIDGRRASLGDDHRHTLGAIGRLAMVHSGRGEFDIAIPMMQEVLDRRRATLGDDHPDLLTAIHDLGTMHQQARQYAEAAPLLAEALQRRREQMGNEHPSTAVSMNNLALALTRLGRADEAIALYEEAVPVLESTFGEEHSNTIITKQNLANLLFNAGRRADAERLFRESIAAGRITLGDEHPNVLMALNNLSFQLKSAGRFDDAEPLVAEALATHRRISGDQNSRTYIFMNNLASIFSGQARYSEAEALFLELIGLVSEGLGPNHIAVPGTLAQMVDQAFVGRPAEAEPHLREALAKFEQVRPAGHPQIETTRSKLGECLASQSKFEDAEPLLVDSARTLSGEFSNLSADSRAAIERVVSLYDAWDRPDDAAIWRDRLNALISSAATDDADGAGGGS